MAKSKFNKQFFVLVIIASIITFSIYFLKGTSIDSKEVATCAESLFMTGGKRTFIDFNGDYENAELKNFSIISLKNKKEIKYKRVSPDNSLDKIFFLMKKF